MQILVTKLIEWEIRIAGWMEQYGTQLLRVSLGVVFIWFGILKPFHMSPAEQLVIDTTSFMVSPDWFIPFLGWWEVTIGVCMLFRATIPVALVLLFLQMPGTMMPFVIVPEVCWLKYPYALSMEGQYIVKNLVLISAALVIGGAQRHKLLGFARFSSLEFPRLLRSGDWHTAEDGEVLIEENSESVRVIFIQKGEVVVSKGEEELSKIGSGQFAGEMGFVTGAPASATVTSQGHCRYIAWTEEKLDQIFADQPQIFETLQTAINRDLAKKLKSMHDSE